MLKKKKKKKKKKKPGPRYDVGKKETKKQKKKKLEMKINSQLEKVFSIAGQHSFVGFQIQNQNFYSIGIIPCSDRHFFYCVNLNKCHY